MKRIIAGLLAAVVLVSAPALFAAGKECPMKAGKKPACCAALDSLTLTADQKTKIDALMADCKKAGCTKAMREKMTTGLKDILTADQYKQWQEQCAATAGKKGCCAAAKNAEKK